jgi:hypothetical protein
MTVNTLSSGKAVGVLADEFASVLGEMDYVFPAVNLALRLGMSSTTRMTLKPCRG